MCLDHYDNKLSRAQLSFAFGIQQKAMTQFEWHDGSIKNVHVDQTLLYDYQKQLGAMVKLYERRIDWLSKDSRRLFGTIIEKK